MKYYSLKILFSIDLLQQHTICKRKVSLCSVYVKCFTLQNDDVESAKAICFIDWTPKSKKGLDTIH